MKASRKYIYVVERFNTVPVFSTCIRSGGLLRDGQTGSNDVRMIKLTVEGEGGGRNKQRKKEMYRRKIRNKQHHTVVKIYLNSQKVIKKQPKFHVIRC